MRLELGAHVLCSDGQPAGRLRDVVVEPVARRVTHLVVRPGHGRPARLVPFALVAADGGGRLALRCSADELARLEPTEDFVLLPPGEHPDAGPGWDVGVEDDVAPPALEAGELGDYVAGVGSPVGVAYDRIPKGTVELRGSSGVECADGRVAGHLGALEVDGDTLTAVVVPRGHLWWRRDVAVPIEDVADLATDAVVVTVASTGL